MAAYATIPLSHSQPLIFKKPQVPALILMKSPQSHRSGLTLSSFWRTKARRMMVVVSAATQAVSHGNKKGSKGGFVEEMRAVAMKLHGRDQAKEGEREPQSPPMHAWEPTFEGYLKFLVDSKLVFDTLERIVDQAAFPIYADFRNTGLERTENIAKDLGWFRSLGHAIPEPSPHGVDYAMYLEQLSGKDPQAFICHFYTIYFGHTAGGMMIGRKVSEKILDGKVLEFYKWDGDLPQLLENVRDNLNSVAEGWTREEKDHCLEETEKSFKFSLDIIHMILS